MQIDILTEQDASGLWSYSFSLNGTEYLDHDFSSRAVALEYARSHARSLFTR